MIQPGSRQSPRGRQRSDQRRTLLSVTCYGCGEPGHYARNCESAQKRTPRQISKSSVKSSDMKCLGCGKLGHYARNCESAAQRKSPRKIGNSSIKSSDMKCFGCGEIGHIARHCVKAVQERRKGSFDEVECYRCGEIGHIARNCKNEAKKLNMDQGRDSRGGWTAWRAAGFNDYSSRASGDVSSPKSRLAQPGSLSTQPAMRDRRGYVADTEQGARNQDDQPKHSSGDLPVHPRVEEPGSGSVQQIRCDICGYGLASEQSLEHHRKNLHPSNQPREWRSEVLNQTYQLSPEVQQHLRASSGQQNIPEMIPSQVFVSRDGDAATRV